MELKFCQISTRPYSVNQLQLQAATNILLLATNTETVPQEFEFPDGTILPSQFPCHRYVLCPPLTRPSPAARATPRIPVPSSCFSTLPRSGSSPAPTCDPPAANPRVHPAPRPPPAALPLECREPVTRAYLRLGSPRFDFDPPCAICMIARAPRRRTRPLHVPGSTLRL